MCIIFWWGCDRASQNLHLLDVLSCAKSVGCGFFTRSKLVPGITATAIQLSYLKLNSYIQTSSEELKSLCDCFLKK